MAKAAYWTVTDAEVRKRGERTGLDTLVVHALNVVDQASGASTPPGAEPNGLSRPPGDYARKSETQRN